MLGTFLQRFAFVLLLIIGSAWASDNKQTINVKFADGRDLDVDVFTYKNEDQHIEMRLEAHRISKVILGHGRDIDHDGKIETWFLIGDNGINRYETASQTKTNLEGAQQVLGQHYNLKGSQFLKSAATSVMTFLFFGADTIYQAQNTFYQEFIDLEEFRLVVDRNKEILSREEYSYCLQLLVNSYQTSFDKYEKAWGANYVKMWTLDAGLILTGMAVFKWAGRFVKGLSKNLQPEMKILAGEGAIQGARFMAGSFRGEAKLILRAIAAKITLRNSLNASKDILLQAARNVKTEWRFVLASFGVQMGVEAYARWDDIYDEDHLQMLKNYLGHPAIIQDIAISTLDSVLMAGASGFVKNRMVKFAVLGMVGAGSSYTVGHVVTGEQTKERMVLDTFWSVGVDAAQFQIDTWALRSFAEKAKAVNNPKLKIVGWMIFLVSQTVGYSAYAAAVDYVDETSLEVKVAPVFAEVDGPTAFTNSLIPYRLHGLNQSANE